MAITFALLFIIVVVLLLWWSYVTRPASLQERKVVKQLPGLTGMGMPPELPGIMRVMTSAMLPKKKASPRERRKISKMLKGSGPPSSRKIRK